MKFIYGERELTLEFHENEVQVITIENRELFFCFFTKICIIRVRDQMEILYCQKVKKYYL